MPITELDNGEFLVVKAVSGLPDPESDGKRISAIVSSENPDSDGDIIRQGKTKHGAGWVLDHFNKIPLLLWQHDRNVPNLSGPDTRAKVGKHEGVGKVLILDPIHFDEGDMFAEHIKGKVERKVIRESSVGFRGIKSTPRRGKGDEYLGREFFEQKLIEVSFANRGSNLDTDTAMKNLIGYGGHALETQGGGDAAIAELKEELSDIMRQLTEFGNVIKNMGDDISACEHKVEMVNKVRSTFSQRSKLIDDLHGALKQFGSAT